MLSNEKVNTAISRIKYFAPVDGDKYYLCYSGGKDSDCIRILSALSGVPYEIHYNLTSVDAPETVQYIKSIPNVIIDKPVYKDGSPKTMWNLIPKKKLPPTRLMRYCCSELKESGGKGRLKMTGIRWAESYNRRINGDVIRIIGKENSTKRLIEESGIDLTISSKGGVLMHYDNEVARDKVDLVHHCYVDRSVTVNPIVDWEDSDVWDFLHYYNCPANPLYQCGESRIGCIGCPLSGGKSMERDFWHYPKYRANYVKAFDRMLKARLLAGLSNNLSWQTGEDVLHWWIQDDYIPGQLSFFDSEVIDILSDLR